VFQKIAFRFTGERRLRLRLWPDLRRHAFFQCLVDSLAVRGRGWQDASYEDYILNHVSKSGVAIALNKLLRHYFSQFELRLNALFLHGWVCCDGTPDLHPALHSFWTDAQCPTP
jgi:hypothetical protein